MSLTAPVVGASLFANRFSQRITCLCEARPSAVVSHLGASWLTSPATTMPMGSCLQWPTDLDSPCILYGTTRSCTAGKSHHAMKLMRKWTYSHLALATPFFKTACILQYLLITSPQPGMSSSMFAFYLPMIARFARRPFHYLRCSVFFLYSVCCSQFLQRALFRPFVQSRSTFPRT